MSRDGRVFRATAGGWPLTTITILLLTMTGMGGDPAFADGTPRDQPYPVIDLRDWDPETEGLRALRGTWGFAWRHVYDPATRPAPGPTFDLTFEMPRTWDAYRLYGREVEIAMLAADGLSNKEISAVLFISEATVRTHVYRFFRKMDTGNRTELARTIFPPA